MFESVVAKVLTATLGDYIENLDKQSLSVGVWNGKFKLTDLIVKRSALDLLDLPFSVVNGTVGLIEADIPWKSISTSSIKVRLSDIMLVVQPRRCEKIDETSERKRQRMVKQRKLTQYELRRKSENEVSNAASQATTTNQTEETNEKNEKNEKKQEGFVSRLTETIINNLQIEINNIHVRYEDDSDERFKVVMGATLESLSMSSCDVNWQESFLATTAKTFFKKLTLRNLSVYMNNNETELFSLMKNDLDNRKFIEHMRNIIVEKKNYRRFVLSPVNGELLLCMQKDEALDLERPRISAELRLESVNATLDERQYRNIQSTLDYITQFMEKPFDRPMFNSQNECQQYLSQSTDEKVTQFKNYMLMFKRSKKVAWLQPLTKDEAEKLLELEDFIHVDDIMKLREAAYLEIQIEEQKYKQKKKESSYWSKWFGSIDKTIEVTEEDRVEFSKLFGLEEDKGPSFILPPHFVNFALKVKINTIGVKLRNASTRTAAPDSVAVFELTQLLVDFKLRVEGFNVEVSLGGVSGVDNFSTRNEQSISEYYNFVKTNSVGNFVEFKMDSNPMNGVEQMDCKVGNLNVVLNLSLIQKMLSIFILPKYLQRSQFTAPSLPDTLKITKKILNAELDSISVIIPDTLSGKEYFQAHLGHSKLTKINEKIDISLTPIKLLHIGEAEDFTIIQPTDFSISMVQTIDQNLIDVKSTPLMVDVNPQVVTQLVRLGDTVSHFTNNPFGSSKESILIVNNVQMKLPKQEELSSAHIQLHDDGRLLVFKEESSLAPSHNIYFNTVQFHTETNSFKVVDFEFVLSNAKTFEEWKKNLESLLNKSISKAPLPPAIETIVNFSLDSIVLRALNDSSSSEVVAMAQANGLHTNVLARPNDNQVKVTLREITLHDGNQRKIFFSDHSTNIIEISIILCSNKESEFASQHSSKMFLNIKLSDMNLIFNTGIITKLFLFSKKINFEKESPIVMITEDDSEDIFKHEMKLQGEISKILVDLEREDSSKLANFSLSSLNVNLYMGKNSLSCEGDIGTAYLSQPNSTSTYPYILSPKYLGDRSLIRFAYSQTDDEPVMNIENSTRVVRGFTEKKSLKLAMASIQFIFISQFIEDIQSYFQDGPLWEALENGGKMISDYSKELISQQDKKLEIISMDIKVEDPVVIAPIQDNTFTVHLGNIRLTNKGDWVENGIPCDSYSMIFNRMNLQTKINGIEKTVTSPFNVALGLKRVLKKDHFPSMYLDIEIVPKVLFTLEHAQYLLLFQLIDSFNKKPSESNEKKQAEDLEKKDSLTLIAFIRIKSFELDVKSVAENTDLAKLEVEDFQMRYFKEQSGDNMQFLVKSIIGTDLRAEKNEYFTQFITTHSKTTKCLSGSMITRGKKNEISLQINNPIVTIIPQVFKELQEFFSTMKLATEPQEEKKPEKEIKEDDLMISVKCNDIRVALPANNFNQLAFVMRCKQFSMEDIHNFNIHDLDLSFQKNRNKYDEYTNYILHPISLNVSYTDTLIIQTTRAINIRISTSIIHQIRQVMDMFTSELSKIKKTTETKLPPYQINNLPNNKVDLSYFANFFASFNQETRSETFKFEAYLVSGISILLVTDRNEIDLPALQLDIEQAIISDFIRISNIQLLCFNLNYGVWESLVEPFTVSGSRKGSNYILDIPKCLLNFNKNTFEIFKSIMESKERSVITRTFYPTIVRNMHPTPITINDQLLEDGQEYIVQGEVSSISFIINNQTFVFSLKKKPGTHILSSECLLTVEIVDGTSYFTIHSLYSIENQTDVTFEVLYNSKRCGKLSPNQVKYLPNAPFDKTNLKIRPSYSDEYMSPTFEDQNSSQFIFMNKTSSFYCEYVEDIGRNMKNFTISPPLKLENRTPIELDMEINGKKFSLQKESSLYYYYANKDFSVNILTNNPSFSDQSFSATTSKTMQICTNGKTIPQKQEPKKSKSFAEIVIRAPFWIFNDLELPININGINILPFNYTTMNINNLTICRDDKNKFTPNLDKIPHDTMDLWKLGDKRMVYYLRETDESKYMYLRERYYIRNNTKFDLNITFEKNSFSVAAGKTQPYSHYNDSLPKMKITLGEEENIVETKCQQELSLKFGKFLNAKLLLKEQEGSMFVVINEILLPEFYVVNSTDLEIVIDKEGLAPKNIKPYLNMPQSVIIDTISEIITLNKITMNKETMKKVGDEEIYYTLIPYQQVIILHIHKKKKTEEKDYELAVDVTFYSIGISIIGESQELAFIHFDQLFTKFGMLNTQFCVYTKLRGLQVDDHNEQEVNPVQFVNINSSEQSFIEFTIEKNGNYFETVSVTIREMLFSSNNIFIQKMSDVFASAMKQMKAVQETKLNQFLQYFEVEESEKMFFGKFELNPLKVDASFKVKPSNDLKYDLVYILSSYGTKFTHIENAIIRIYDFKLPQSSFVTMQDVMERVGKHYKRQIKYNLLSIIGSLNTFGSPIQLFGDLASGVTSLFYEPANAITEGPHMFLLGVGKGSVGFISNSVKGVTGFTSTITGTVGNTLSIFTLDRDFVEKRDRIMERKPANIFQGIGQGMQVLFTGLIDGGVGIIAQPIKGARKEGALGLAKGVVLGIVGIPTKPVVGMIDFSIKQMQGIRNFNQSSLHKIRENPRMLFNGVIKPYKENMELFLRLIHKSQQSIEFNILIPLGKTLAITNRHLLIPQSTNSNALQVVELNQVEAIEQVDDDNVKIRVANQTSYCVYLNVEAATVRALVDKMLRELSTN
ncbi:predicted protein [Naegleria gruberi]|uniref:Predicted protein n=1 Tax=Naegleria gruberi TaxID=5762 RepID=D2W0F6_NAEGR|nr:uncharacterized protein NAEGRDRAFT_74840 [Naegleria gruberi]EFC37423.1 predicted protein [Naegleria gruberi]|eukprot:XP_002670167.1 predicted protein [Naegleria gruberi strain NEG-M]